MSAHSEPIPLQAPRRRLLPALRDWSEREEVFSWLMILPPMAFLVALVGYPFMYGIVLSLENRPVAQPGTFIGLGNFLADFRDPTFWQVVQNTFVYTAAATLLKMVGGLGLALVMNQAFRLKNLVRAVLLLPFIVPTVLSTIAWMWILDPSFSVINWLLVHGGLAERGPSWLGPPAHTLPRPALLRHHAARRAADDTARTLRGRHHRWRRRARPLPLCHLAAAQAGGVHRDDVLADLYVLRLPAGLCADSRRTRQRHAPVRDLRVRYRHD